MGGNDFLTDGGETINRGGALWRGERTPEDTMHIPFYIGPK